MRGNPRHPSPESATVRSIPARAGEPAGLSLPVALARHLGLCQLVDRHVDLRRAPRQQGNKLLALVASALAGGDCIDDADALRAGGTDRVLGCTAKAPSTLGPFLRSFQWGHVRQLDRVSREPLARAWTARIGLGEAVWPSPRPCGGVSLPWPDGFTRQARRLTLHLPQG